MTLELVARTHDQLGESPVWCADTGTLVWTDITGRRLHRLHETTGELHHWTSPLAIGSLAHARGDTFVAATEHGFAWLALGKGPEAQLCSVTSLLADRPDLRFNDGRCDRQGRFWASSMAWTPDPATPKGTLWRWDENAATPTIPDLVIGNGLAWSPDGRTLYLADSTRSRAMVWAFDFDPDDGVPHGRRVFADFRGTGGRPDGAAIDTDGCYWVAATDAGEIRRYTPCGRLDLTIAVPVAHPTMPSFGGADLRTLYVTSMRPTQAEASELDGCVFAINVGLQGMAEAAFTASGVPPEQWFRPGGDNGRRCFNP